MDLSALGSTLPAGLADAEREMGDKFRASALSITNLYKSSLGYTKQAYQVGYSACIADVLSTVQSSIGAGQDATQTLSRLMDWAEARETAMAAFAAEDGDDAPLNTPGQTPAQPHPHRRAAHTRNQIHLQAATRPSSAPIPDSYYQHRTPHVHPSSDNTPGPSRQPMRGVQQGAREGGDNIRMETGQSGGDPDRTFVQGSTPSAEATPASGSRSMQSETGAGPGGMPSSSPTVSIRPVGGNGRISRSPLRYRHDASSAPTSFTLPSVPFAPSLPPNLTHPSSASTLLPVPPMTTTSIPIGVGSKRPITAVHLDADLDVPMTDDGMPSGASSGVSRGGRSSKRRNVDRREGRDVDGSGTSENAGREKEREERKRGRKGKDTGGG